MLLVQRAGGASAQAVPDRGCSMVNVKLYEQNEDGGWRRIGQVNYPTLKDVTPAVQNALTLLGKMEPKDVARVGRIVCERGQDTPTELKLKPKRQAKK